MQEVVGSTPIFSTTARHSFNEGGGRELHRNVRLLLWVSTRGLLPYRLNSGGRCTEPERTQTGKKYSFTVSRQNSLSGIFYFHHHQFLRISKRKSRAVAPFHSGFRSTLRFLFA